MEMVVWGYGLIEAPRVSVKGQIYFSDVFNGGVYCWSPDNTVETIIPKRRGIGGLALHQNGGIVVTGKTVIHQTPAETRTLLALDDVVGFNDLMTDRAGRVYVSSLRSSSLEMNERIPGDTWRIEQDGQKTLIYDNVSFPNGIGFSPNERILYQSNYDAGVILAHDLADDGRWVNRRVFASVPRGNPDGLAVDDQGQVWVALGSGGGLACFQPDGQIAQVLDIPATFVASLCFGGDDHRDLYIATAGNTVSPERGGVLFRTRSDVPGLIAPLASV